MFQINRSNTKKRDRICVMDSLSNEVGIESDKVIINRINSMVSPYRLMVFFTFVRRSPCPLKSWKCLLQYPRMYINDASYKVRWHFNSCVSKCFQNKTPGKSIITKCDLPSSVKLVATGSSFVHSLKLKSFILCQYLYNHVRCPSICVQFLHIFMWWLFTLPFVCSVAPS